MKVERFPIQMFENTDFKENYPIVVPEGSKLLAVKILHDGIYAFYAIPEIEVALNQKEVFILMKPNQSIPDNADFIDVLDTVIETPKGQGIMIFPIYKLKADVQN